jgi:hypothetical protein
MTGGTVPDLDQARRFLELRGAWLWQKPETAA